MYGVLFERIMLVELANCYPFVLPSTACFDKGGSQKIKMEI